MVMCVYVYTCVYVCKCMCVCVCVCVIAELEDIQKSGNVKEKRLKEGGEKEKIQRKRHNYSP